MNKRQKLLMCDWGLVLIAFLTLASAVQLEACGGQALWGLSFMTWVIIHIVLCVTMMVMVAWHMYLHFGWREWVEKLRKTPKKPTRILALVAALVLLTGLVATIMILVHAEHTSFGGVHGKIGFLMLAIAIGHTIKRAKFLKK